MRVYVLQYRQRGVTDWISDSATITFEKRDVQSSFDHAVRDVDFEVTDLISAQRAVAYFEKQQQFEYRIASTDDVEFHDAEIDTDWWK